MKEYNCASLSKLNISILKLSEKHILSHLYNKAVLKD